MRLSINMLCCRAQQYDESYDAFFYWSHIDALWLKSGVPSIVRLKKDELDKVKKVSSNVHFAIKPTNVPHAWGLKSFHNS